MSWLSRTAPLALGSTLWACGSGGGTTAGTGGHAGAAATSSSASSTTTSSSTSGSGGAGGGSGGMAGCGVGEKLCGATCRLTTDPAAGCADPACAPCLNDHGTTACAGGVCAPKCLLGWDDCDGDPANGCEHDVLTDPLHCGACATACAVAHGTAGCAQGLCTVAGCDPGFGDCDHDAANGCEASLDGGTCP